MKIKVLLDKGEESVGEEKGQGTVGLGEILT